VITIHVVGAPADNAASRPDRAAVLSALRSLEPLHRDLIRRAHFGGRTTQEIAADLDLPEPVVKCELHRTLHIMRRLVASGYDAERQ
jgi:RNA polymerase sigma-70 factor (ECF subfamily)